jgi:hypothetical protein
MAEEDEIQKLFDAAFKKARECPRRSEARKVVESVMDDAAIFLGIRLTLAEKDK